MTPAPDAGDGESAWGHRSIDGGIGAANTRIGKRPLACLFCGWHVLVPGELRSLSRIHHWPSKPLRSSTNVSLSFCIASSPFARISKRTLGSVVAASTGTTTV